MGNLNKMKEYHYQIYGLNVISSRPIAVLKTASFDQEDLKVLWLSGKNSPPHLDLEWQQVITTDLKTLTGIHFFKAATDTGIYHKIRFELDNSDIDFVLSPDKKNIWTIHDEAEIATELDAYFVGPILGAMLRLKNVLCLHASVVNIDGYAVLIVGNRRSGKSTTAAAFSKLGYSVLADDLGVLSLKDNRFYVESGYSKVRLRPQSAAVLYAGEPTDLPLVYNYRPTRYLDIGEQFFKGSLPLGAIYLLSDAQDPDVLPHLVPVPSIERLVRLNQNTFGNYVITPDLRKDEFRTLSLLARDSDLPIQFLKRGYDLKHLNQQCQVIIDNLKKTIKNTEGV